jgi:hypothetical protein
VKQSFSLQPWAANLTLDLTLGGTIERRGRQLQVTYCLGGAIDSLVIPELVAQPQRRMGLWEATCLELFIGVPGRSDYWEVNLSPSGDWNVFHLDDYRRGLREVAAVTALPCRVHQSPGELEVQVVVELELPEILELGVTAVLGHRSGELSYWALAHNGPEADFHRRDSFVIEL